jgi:hypothetical protein
MSVHPPVPPAMAERPVDPATGRPVPFYAPDEGDADPGAPVVKARAVQCALSRLCGGCGLSLGFPLAFIGDTDELAARRFRRPPMHVECAGLLLSYDDALGLHRTGSFDLERPGREAADRSVHFRAGPPV